MRAGLGGVLVGYALWAETVVGSQVRLCNSAAGEAAQLASARVGAACIHEAALTGVYWLVAGVGALLAIWGVVRYNRPVTPEPVVYEYPEEE